MKTLMLIAAATLSLAACSAPTLNGQSDTAQLLSDGFPQPTVHSGPYDNTANSLGGRFAGTAGGN